MTKLVIKLIECTLFFIPTGKVVVELAKSRLIQADVLLHPAFVSVDDIKGMNFQYLDCFLICIFVHRRLVCIL